MRSADHEVPERIAVPEERMKADCLAGGALSLAPPPLESEIGN